MWFHDSTKLYNTWYFSSCWIFSPRQIGKNHSYFNIAILLSHGQGCLLNASKLSARLGVLNTTIQQSSYGSEIDLIIDMPPHRIAIEIKRSLNPKPSQGFFSACDSTQSSIYCLSWKRAIPYCRKHRMYFINWYVFWIKETSCGLIFN